MILQDEGVIVARFVYGLSGEQWLSSDVVLPRGSSYNLPLYRLSDSTGLEGFVVPIPTAWHVIG